MTFMAIPKVTMDNSHQILKIKERKLVVMSNLVWIDILLVIGI